MLPTQEHAWLLAFQLHQNQQSPAGHSVMAILGRAAEIIRLHAPCEEIICAAWLQFACHNQVQKHFGSRIASITQIVAPIKQPIAIDQSHDIKRLRHAAPNIQNLKLAQVIATLDSIQNTHDIAHHYIPFAANVIDTLSEANHSIVDSAKKALLRNMLDHAHLQPPYRISTPRHCAAFA